LELYAKDRGQLHDAPPALSSAYLVAETAFVLINGVSLSIVFKTLKKALHSNCSSSAFFLKLKREA